MKELQLPKQFVVLNEEEQDGIMGSIPSELLKTRWEHI